MTRFSANRFAAALVPLLLFAGSGRTVVADTSSQTGVTIEIVDEGSLEVAWGSGSPTFLVDGETPALTASTPSVTATASFNLIIADTRADGNRAGYSISLAASGFTTRGDTAIPASQLTVIGVDAASDGVSAATSLGQSLDSPVRLVTVGPDAPALNTTLTITVAMTIHAGTPPGTYAGSFSFEVLPLLAP